MRYALPAPIGGQTLAESGGSFTIDVLDAWSWIQVLAQTVTGVTITPGTPSDAGVVTDDHTPPFPFQANPIRIMVMQISRLSASPSAKIHYQVTDGNSNGLPDLGESLRVYGDAGAAPAGQPLYLADLSKPGSATLTGTSGPDGSFRFDGIALEGAEKGDILVLSIGATLVDPQSPVTVVFSRALGGTFTDPATYPIRIVEQGSADAISGDVRLSGDKRTLTFTLSAAWQGDTAYEVSFPGLKNCAGDAFPADFKAAFRTAPGAVSTGSVDNQGIFRAAAEFRGHNTYSSGDTIPNS